MLRLAGGRCTRAPTHLLCPLMLLLHFCSAAVDCVLYWLLASPGCALVLRASCLIAALPRRPPPPLSLSAPFFGFRLAQPAPSALPCPICFIPFFPPLYCPAAGPLVTGLSLLLPSSCCCWRASLFSLYHRIAIGCTPQAHACMLQAQARPESAAPRVEHYSKRRRLGGVADLQMLDMGAAAGHCQLCQRAGQHIARFENSSCSLF